MTVYVDNTRAKYGRMIMCHLIADTDEELHAMVDKIGVNQCWHQSPPKASHSHYDIALSKRALAISFGAIEVSVRQAAVMVNNRKRTGVLGTPEEAQAILDARFKI